MIEPAAILPILTHPLGLCVGSASAIARCKSYNFWSGIASDLGEITLLAGAVGLYRHVNCEQKGCWRPGHRHPDHGRPVCRRHYHSDVVPALALNSELEDHEGSREPIPDLEDIGASRECSAAGGVCLYPHSCERERKCVGGGLNACQCDGCYCLDAADEARAEAASQLAMDFDPSKATVRTPQPYDPYTFCAIDASGRQPLRGPCAVQCPSCITTQRLRLQARR